MVVLAVPCSSRVSCLCLAQPVVRQYWEQHACVWIRYVVHAGCTAWGHVPPTTSRLLILRSSVGTGEYLSRRWFDAWISTSRCQDSVRGYSSLSSPACRVFSPARRIYTPFFPGIIRVPKPLSLSLLLLSTPPPPRFKGRGEDALSGRRARRNEQRHRPHYGRSSRRQLLGLGRYARCLAIAAYRGDDRLAGCGNNSSGGGRRGGRISGGRRCPLGRRRFGVGCGGRRWGRRARCGEVTGGSPGGGRQAQGAAVGAVRDDRASEGGEMRGSRQRVGGGENRGRCHHRDEGKFEDRFWLVGCSRRVCAVPPPFHPRARQCKNTRESFHS